MDIEDEKIIYKVQDINELSKAYLVLATNKHKGMNLSAFRSSLEADIMFKMLKVAEKLMQYVGDDEYIPFGNEINMGGQNSIEDETGEEDMDKQIEEGIKSELDKLKKTQEGKKEGNKEVKQ